MLKSKVKFILKHLFFWQRNLREIYIFVDKRQEDSYPDLLERSEFYLSGKFKIVRYKNAFDFFRFLILYGPYRAVVTTSSLRKFLVSTYFINIDYKTNPVDGWAWHEALNLVSPIQQSEIQESKKRLLEYKQGLSQYTTSLILGTGPSLIKARKLVHLDCYKIACNTIVKDTQLWAQLRPHFIVAGDAIYHFGHNKYATSFRNDLKKCLALNEAIFIYPALYHPFVKKEFSRFTHLLVPIPTGTSDQINYNLFEDFSLPAIGNVLNLLLLPLSTSLTKNIYLLGFDGRAPDDKLFWSNSNDHSYAEFIPDIQVKHPMFFEYFIDNKNPFKYVNTVHGDSLDNNLTALEKLGFEFALISKSYTPTLQKRFKPIFELD